MSWAEAEADGRSEASGGGGRVRGRRRSRGARAAGSRRCRGGAAEGGAAEERHEEGFELVVRVVCGGDGVNPGFVGEAAQGGVAGPAGGGLDVAGAGDVPREVEVRPEVRQV